MSKLNKIAVGFRQSAISILKIQHFVRRKQIAEKKKAKI